MLSPTRGPAPRASIPSSPKQIGDRFAGVPPTFESGFTRNEKYSQFRLGNMYVRQETAVVTGPSGGIGASLVEAYLKEGSGLWPFLIQALA